MNMDKMTMAKRIIKKLTVVSIKQMDERKKMYEVWRRQQLKQLDSKCTRWPRTKMMNQLKLIRFALSTLGHVLIKHRFWRTRARYCPLIHSLTVWVCVCVYFQMKWRNTTTAYYINFSRFLLSFSVCRARSFCISVFSMQAVEFGSFCSFVISLSEFSLILPPLYFFFYSLLQCPESSSTFLVSKFSLSISLFPRFGY